MPSLEIRTLETLEFEFHTKPGIERTQIARIGVSVHSRRTDSGRLAEVGIRNADRALRVLIHAQQGLAVGEVEQVSTQAEPRPFRDPDGIVHVVVDLTAGRRSSRCPRCGHRRGASA